MKGNKLLKKLNGYQKAPRNRFCLLKEAELTHEELLLYELGLAIADWDPEHIDTFGTFKATNEELAELLGWSCGSTVSRHKTELINKGFLIRDEDGRIRPKDFENWLYQRNSYAKMLTVSAEKKVPRAYKQEELAKMHEFRPQKSISSLSSFKVNSSLGGGNREVLNDEEIDRICSDLEEKEEKNLDEMSDDEIVQKCTEIFGEGTRLSDE